MKSALASKMACMVPAFRNGSPSGLKRWQHTDRFVHVQLPDVEFVNLFHAWHAHQLAANRLSNEQAQKISLNQSQHTAEITFRSTVLGTFCSNTATHVLTAGGFDEMNQQQQTNQAGL